MLEFHVIPIKSGLWRVVNVSEEPQRLAGSVWLSPRMFRLWRIAYRRWYVTKGHRLASSPEMWVETSVADRLGM